MGSAQKVYLIIREYYQALKALESDVCEAESSGLRADILEAKRDLKTAENCMLTFGLSLFPWAIRRNLKRKIKKDYAARLEMIDLVSRLNPYII